MKAVTFGWGSPILLTTPGFRSLSPDHQVEAMTKAGAKLTETTDWVVLDPQAKKEGYEDQGQTFHATFSGPKKVYAIRDDYRTVEALRENSGEDVNSRYALTLLLAEEY